MITWPNFFSQLFNGLASGALLALIASGLTIIYGTLGVLNLAHGAMFMLGGYAGYVAFQATGSFALALVAGALFLVVVGGLIELVIIRQFYRRPPEDQLLVTFGIGIVLVELVRFIFGSLSLTVPAPAFASGITPMGFMIYPTYRLVVMGIASVALAALYVVLYRTRLGMIVRAGIEDSGHGRHARHQRLPRLHGGVRHRRDGGGVRRDRQRAGGVADAQRGRIDPGADLRGHRHRGRGVVPGRHPRRADRRRDPEPHLDGQSRLFRGHAVRGHDAGAAVAAAGPARLAGRE